jgi:hypothetical protein
MRFRPHIRTRAHRSYGDVYFRCAALRQGSDMIVTTHQPIFLPWPGFFYKGLRADTTIR